VARRWAKGAPATFNQLGRAQKPRATFLRRKCCTGKKYKQLSLEERTMIQTQLSMGFKPGQIAQELGRSASTLSWELKSNGWFDRSSPDALDDRD